ncbi:MAG: HAMP domain-containing methyl-accepting chemotaxis protein [Psychrobium sp.]
MKLTLKRKLILSFSCIVAVILSTALYSLYSVQKVTDARHRITDYRIETVNAEKEIKNGINQSLAALRGYMILGSDPTKAKAMKESRQQAWQSINNGMAILKADADHLSLEDQEQLKQLEVILAEFKQAQQSVEDIAQSPANIPAYQLLLDKAVPTGNVLLQAITNIINIEATLPATPERKALLKLFADSRGSLATGLASIRAYLLSGDESFKHQFDQKWIINSQRFNQINGKFQNILTPEQATHWQTYSEARDVFEFLPSQMFDLRSSVEWNQANFLLGTEAAPRAQRALTILKNIEAHESASLSADIAELNEISDGQNGIIIIGSILSIAMCIGVALSMNKDFLMRVMPILEKAKAITNNNLAAPPLEITGNDELTELTQAVNAMNESLTSTIQLTANTMQDTSEQADSIYNANANMSTNITAQTDQMSLIASAVEELSASANEVSTTSSEAADTAKTSYDTAVNGGEIVEKSLAQMNEISAAFDDSANSISALSQQSQQIGEILSVIHGIAEQTNLLALNAAIEAARAGEQGRGFAVVADEVRQLASRTTQATSDVEESIEKIRHHTQLAVSSMDVGRERVSKGIEESNSVAAILSQIIEQASDVSHRIESIAATAKQQSTVTHEIATNSDEASRMSQQVSQSISEVVNLSETVSKATQQNALQLTEMVRG